MNTVGVSAFADTPTIVSSPILRANSSDEAKSFYRLYSKAFRLKNYDKAAMYGEAYCQYCLMYGDWQTIPFATDLNNLAYVKNKIGSVDEAIEYSSLCLKLRRQLLEPTNPEYLNTLHNLSTYYEKNRDFDKAIKLREEQYLRLDSIGKVGGAISSAMSLTTLYIRSGRFTESLSLLQQLAQKYQFSSSENQKWNYLKALALIEFGKYKEGYEIASSEFSKLLKSDAPEDIKFKYLQLVSASSIAMGKKDGLLRHINEYARSENLQGLDKSVLLNDLADLTNDTIASIELRKEAVQEALSHKQTSNLAFATILTNLSNELSELGHSGEAIEYALMALNILKEIKGNHTPISINTLHSLSVNSLALEDYNAYYKYLREELEILDKMKGWNFINVAQTDKFDFLSRYIDIKDLAMYGSLESSIPETSCVLYDVALKYKSAIFSSERHPLPEKEVSETIDYTSIRNALGNDEIAIEFMTTSDESSYLACLIRRNWETPKIVFLSELGILEPFLANPNEIYKSSTLQSVIWEIITEEGEINPGETIYFSPDGILNKIAIEYLPLATGELMASVYDCHRVISTSVICDKHEKFSVSSTGIVNDYGLNNIQSEARGYGNGTPMALGGASEEFNVISSLLQKHGIGTKLVPALTETNGTAELMPTGILHVACHGYYKEPHKRLSSSEKFEWGQNNSVLSVSTNQLENSILIISAKDISSLQLNSTKLVILAACQTNLGTYTFDGVSGLNRAFFLAGAKSSISSLWDVNDATTLKLMESFYEHLFSGSSPREALRMAVVEIKDLTDEPVYWAPFILTENVIFE